MENISYEDLKDPNISFIIKYSLKENQWVAQCKGWTVIKGIDNRRPQLALENLCEAIFSVMKIL